MLEKVNENEYKTSDFTEAVVLKYFGHVIIFVDKTDKRAVFYFASQRGTTQLLNAFRERELSVEPFSYYQCEREIKSRIYND